MQVFKKIIIWILLIVVQQYNYCCAADMKVVESYYVLKYEYSEFLTPLVNGGAKESALLDFFDDVEVALNKIDGLTKQNIETHLKDVLMTVATYRENRNLSAIIFSCYQTDIEEYIVTEKVPTRLQGLYDAMVRAIFGEAGLQKVELAKIYELSVTAYNNQGAYTAETVAVLQGAIINALPVLKNRNASEAQIAEAKEMLEIAYAGLKRKPGSEQGGTDGAGASGTGDGGITNIPTTNSLFKDLPDGHWSYDAVKYLAERDILSGYEDGSFKPDALVKREEVARMLCSALALENIESQTAFGDVKSGAWYEEYVRLIAAHGIMQGVGNDMFGVGSTLTRQDLAVIADRLISDGFINNTFIENSDGVVFADLAKAAPYARASIGRMKRLGIISGVGDNKFAPRNGVTRSQVAQIIYNLINQN